MADYRIPGTVCASNRPSIDEGTLVRWCTKPPGPYCSVPEPEPRYWHSHSVQGGFSASTLTMSPKAVALLQSIEALRLKPYDDQTGKAITDWVTGATIGYGHLIKKEDWDTYKDGITRDQADTLFLTDAEPFEKTVGKTIHFGVQQYEFDAMVILAFNIGKAGFQKSTAAKLINQRQEKISNKNLWISWRIWRWKKLGKRIISHRGK